MKKSIRFIVLLLSLTFLISGLAMVFCHAEPGDGVDVSGGGDGVDVGGGDGGDGGDVSGGDNAEPADGGDNSNVSGGDNGQSGGDNGQSGGDNGQSGGDNGSDSGGYSDNSGQGGYDYDPIAYGENSNYDYNITDNGDTVVSSATPNTTLYDSSGMSAADAAPEQWSEITLDEKTIRTGVTDFSAIQEDTEIEDNSLPLLRYLLLLRYPLLILSLLGIIFVIVDFIISKSNYRKAVRSAERRAARSEQRRAATAHSGSYESDRYSDTEYRTRFADEDATRSRKVSSRADTGEVYVPRRVAKKSK